MRKLAIAMALASTALATPAVARDNSFYVGVEGGVMWVEDTPITVVDGLTNPQFNIDHKAAGWDVDAIAGYDFGPVRVEAEVGFKRASIDAINTVTTVFPADGHGRVFSLMGNVLFDFGDEDGLSGYAGGGLGLGSVKYSADADFLDPFGPVSFDDSASKLAWQAIIGMRYAISPNIDLGLKYRLFNVSRLEFNDDFDDGPVSIEGRWRSHSLLASLIYNFAAPVALPPPPPPPAPERG